VDVLSRQDPKPKGGMACSEAGGGGEMMKVARGMEIIQRPEGVTGSLEHEGGHARGSS
jgi:hypothetical protein